MGRVLISFEGVFMILLRSASSIGKRVLLLGVLAVTVWLPTGTLANGQVASATATSTAPTKKTIQAAQKRLLALGYQCGAADGVMGAKAIAALKKFQVDHGLHVSGLLDSSTMEALNASIGNITPTSKAKVETASSGAEAIEKSMFGLPILGHGGGQGDITIGDSSPGPSHSLSPVDLRGIQAWPGGLQLGIQSFGFDPKTNEVGLVTDTPYGQQIYGNSVIDGSGLANHKHLSFGELLTPSAGTAALIGLSFEVKSKLFISPQYVVSPADVEARPESKGYYVAVVFDPSDSRTGQCSVYGMLTVNLAGGVPRQFDLPAPSPSGPADSCFARQNVDGITFLGSGFHVLPIANINRKEDVLEWSVETFGRTTYRGTIRFPVVGTSPDLVFYRVYLAENPAHN
jgi:peptidoglycan hydrolase-like protein with peptidoglycan-binding domain